MLKKLKILWCGFWNLCTCPKCGEGHCDACNYSGSELLKRGGEQINSETYEDEQSI